jgi:hypothetical protein
MTPGGVVVFFEVLLGGDVVSAGVANTMGFGGFVASDEDDCFGLAAIGADNYATTLAFVLGSEDVEILLAELAALKILVIKVHIAYLYILLISF